MPTVTVSSKFQVVIPQAVREKIGIKPGQKLHVLVDNNQVILIPVRSVREARGSLKFKDSDLQREEEDEGR